MNFALKIFLSLKWEEFDCQPVHLAPGFKDKTPGETLQQTPKTQNQLRHIIPGWKVLFQGGTIKHLSGTASGMQVSSLPAKSFNRLGRMQTPTTQVEQSFPHLGLGPSRVGGSEGKAALLSNLKRLCKSSSCGRIPP